MELFDEEEKELLSAHRQKYLEKAHHSFIAKKQSIEDDHGENHPFGNSVIDAFNDLYIVKEPVIKVIPKASEM